MKFVIRDRADYEYARKEQSFLEGRIQALELGAVGVDFAVVGVAVVAVAAGLRWAGAATLAMRDIFAAGVVLSRGGVLFGSLGSVAAALMSRLRDTGRGWEAAPGG